MADELPAGLFVTNGIWLLADGPVPNDPREAIRRVMRAGSDPDEAYVPAFTSRESGVEFARLFVAPGRTEPVDVFACGPANKLGAFLQGLAIIGHTHIAFDPEPGNATRVPIRDAVDALHRHLFPNSLN